MKLKKRKKLAKKLNATVNAFFGIIPDKKHKKSHKQYASHGAE